MEQQFTPNSQVCASMGLQNSEGMEAMWGCTNQLWVPGRSCLYCAWASVPQFLLHNSATLKFLVLMSMQVDAEFKKEQIGNLFCLVGALERGFGVS
jgi:hypothetical protein